MTCNSCYHFSKLDEHVDNIFVVSLLGGLSLFTFLILHLIQYFFVEGDFFINFLGQILNNSPLNLFSFRREYSADKFKSCRLDFTVKKWSLNNGNPYNLFQEEIPIRFQHLLSFDLDKRVYENESRISGKVVVIYIRVFCDHFESSNHLLHHQGNILVGDWRGTHWRLPHCGNDSIKS